MATLFLQNENGRQSKVISDTDVHSRSFGDFCFTLILVQKKREVGKSVYCHFRRRKKVVRRSILHSASAAHPGSTFRHVFQLQCKGLHQRHNGTVKCCFSSGRAWTQWDRRRYFADKERRTEGDAANARKKVSALQRSPPLSRKWRALTCGGVLSIDGGWPWRPNRILQ